MAYNRIIETKSTVARSREKIAANSAAITSGDLVTISGGFVAAATNGVVDGIAVQTKTYAADNQTVAKATLQYVVDPTAIVRMEIAGGTITVADEGKYFTCTDGNTVNGTTESTLVGSVRMNKFISATLGDFMIVNKFATV